MSEIIEIVSKLQPFYEELNSKYSDNYLFGSSWYVGKSLEKWWNNCNNIRYYRQNVEKLKYICKIILVNKKI